MRCSRGSVGRDFCRADGGGARHRSRLAQSSRPLSTNPCGALRSRWDALPPGTGSRPDGARTPDLAADPSLARGRHAASAAGISRGAGASARLPWQAGAGCGTDRNGCRTRGTQPGRGRAGRPRVDATATAQVLGAFRAAGTMRLLDLFQGAGLRTGLLSDYPAHGKLQALGLAERFSPVLCSTDPDIDAFKPDPRGFLHACAHWKLPPSDVLVIGDRHDVDVAGALAAGMPCALIGRATPGIKPIGYVVFPSLERLASVLDGN